MLPKAIGSVLAQSHKDWELIIIDDGSTDNTKEVVLSYGDERIKYIYQVNQERSAARNNGIVNASGKYICFLDSDDYFLPSRLELLYESIVEKNELIALFFTSICFEKDSIISERKQLEFAESINVFDYIVESIIGTPQVCIHKDILKCYIFNTGLHIGEDMELWLRIADQYPLVFIPDQPTIVATIHDDRSVNEFANNSFQEMTKALKIIFSRDHPGSKISRACKRFVWSGVYFGIARFYISVKNKGKAVFFLIKSLAVNQRNSQSKHKIFLIYKIVFTEKCKLSHLNELTQ